MTGSRDGAVARAHAAFDDGAFLDRLAAWVAIPTESQVPERTPELHRYVHEALVPAFDAMGFDSQVVENSVEGRGPFVVASRIEDPAKPTLLLYGHGDVVRAIESEWSEGLKPYELKVVGDRVYGRGTVDNKGQHLIAMMALESVLAERGGKLGFNVKFLIETGEEQGSPGLKAFVDGHKELLKCDLFAGLDGPRRSFKRMQLDLGCKGGLFFDLVVDLKREGGLHSGHWGGVMPDAGIILAQGIASITTPQGRILVDEWRPKHIASEVIAAAQDIETDPIPGMPEPDPDWGEVDLGPLAKSYCWTGFIVLAYQTGNPDNPVNSVPSHAKARCQIRHTVDIDATQAVSGLQRHLDERGLGIVRVTTEGIGRDAFPASRTDLNDPWVQFVARSMERTTGHPPNIAPNTAASGPNEMFKAGLDVPTMWIPHSYFGCGQHGPDEHGLKGLFREGLGVMAALYWDLAEEETPPARGA
ncbi:MAG: M20/M25/M40 family metallo-hydrolase [Acetobacterales bacterium]